MKKITIIAVIMLIFTLSACNSQQEIKREKLTPTDLSAINIDGLVLGSFIDEIDLTKYTDASDRFEEKENTYFYDELSIKTDADGSIREIKGNVYGYDAEYETVPFSINGTDNPSSIDEVVKILGQNHNEYWFDKEQKIKAYTFYDDNNMMYATFAYDDNSHDLVWIILSK